MLIPLSGVLAVLTGFAFGDPPVDSCADPAVANYIKNAHPRPMEFAALDADAKGIVCAGVASLKRRYFEVLPRLSEKSRLILTTAQAWDNAQASHDGAGVRLAESALTRPTRKADYSIKVHKDEQFYWLTIPKKGGGVEELPETEKGYINDFAELIADLPLVDFEAKDKPPDPPKGRKWAVDLKSLESAVRALGYFKAHAKDETPAKTGGKPADFSNDSEHCGLEMYFVVRWVSEMVKDLSPEERKRVMDQNEFSANHAAEEARIKAGRMLNKDLFGEARMVEPLPKAGDFDLKDIFGLKKKAAEEKRAREKSDPFARFREPQEGPRVIMTSDEFKPKIKLRKAKEPPRWELDIRQGAVALTKDAARRFEEEMGRKPESDEDNKTVSEKALSLVIAARGGDEVPPFMKKPYSTLSAGDKQLFEDYWDKRIGSWKRVNELVGGGLLDPREDYEHCKSRDDCKPRVDERLRNYDHRLQGQVIGSVPGAFIASGLYNLGKLLDRTTGLDIAGPLMDQKFNAPNTSPPSWDSISEGTGGAWDAP